MKRLDGKVVLVTGAGAGIGEEICYRFAEEGAVIAAMDLKADQAQRVAEEVIRRGGQATAMGGNVVNREDCAAFVDRAVADYGAVHVLCNIAGIVATGTLLEASDEDWTQSMDINVRGAWQMCQLVVPHLLKQGGGSVINMASVAGPFGLKSRGVYSVSKAALVGLTKSLAMDFIEQKIRVNAICPGTVETPSWHGRVNQAEDPDQMLKDFIARQPLGRVGQPDEIAALAAYLAADESAYLTGQAIMIDGGLTL